MFDAFVNTMMKPHIAKQCARRINAQTAEKAAKIEEIARDILVKSGVDAELSCRIKGIDSTASKIKRYMKKFDSYQNKREEIHDIFLGRGIGEIIGDSFGIRYTCNTPETAGLFKSVVQRAKNNNNFFVKSIENYYGKATQPYADKNIMDEFAKLQYKNLRGQVKKTTATNALKPSGYTRDNIDAAISGINAEIQIGGIYTTKWGNAEHFLHDIRQGKKLDFSGLTQEQIKIVKELQKEYTKLLRNQKAHDNYTKNYLNQIWKYLKNSEEKNLSVPQLPSFPAGFHDILRAENIMKLAHV